MTLDELETKLIELSAKSHELVATNERLMAEVTWLRDTLLGILMRDLKPKETVAFYPGKNR